MLFYEALNFQPDEDGKTSVRHDLSGSQGVSAANDGLRSRAVKIGQKNFPRCAGRRAAKPKATRMMVWLGEKSVQTGIHINLPNQLATRIFAGYSSLLMASPGSPNPCCCPPCSHAHIGGWGL